ncbi:Zn-finger in Ran binding protein [Oesophagostomum dentatum]|uniref:Zn-finger in Ran binding protein n=1 Tax=Oesophagostomum dentatum TaxID=61180 RepID=A0A0B1SF98_OESDE|nr:Zn-finger in Ran binding protein [Oesophagostomum dentatum]
MSGTGKKRVRKEDAASFDECDAGSWECTVCTYRNRFEAFKCEMCDTRSVEEQCGVRTMTEIKKQWKELVVIILLPFRFLIIFSIECMPHLVY